MRDLLIVAQFSQLPGQKGNGRFHYLANMLTKEQFEVELLTTSHSHTRKEQRMATEEERNSVAYESTVIYEPGYSKNVSLTRIYSHYKFAKNVKEYLINRKKPDIIYCAVPSLSLAKIVAQYAIENEIKFIIDIQDLWPEAFEMVFKIPLISDLLFYPMKKQAEYIYESADEVIAVSETYVNRALKNNAKAQGYSVYLGTDLANFDQLVEENKYTKKPLDEFWVAYIGTLGSSYDLFTVIDSLVLLEEQGIKNIKFIVMGDGPLVSKFQEYARDKEIEADFLGRLNYPDMVGILSVCDLAVNPIRRGSAASIINKVGDYAAAGLPVINTQESTEYQELLGFYQAGLNSHNDNPQEMAENILSLYNNKEKLDQMALSSRRLAEDKFDRQKTYKKIIQVILEEI